ncbi:hypothetical protein BDZ91DRAFT_781477 [Kalaharituber pfeilii]|nr:hypothetical protein BDZ91DRAFT_781477 [Kalaharituber pfeilii]
MSTSPSSGTLLPPAIRFAKILGTLGAGALAGTYLTHSSHTLPALEASKRATTPATTGGANISQQQPASQAVKIFHRIHRASHTLLLNLILVSAGSYSYIAYYIYNYPLDVGEISSASATYSSSSFMPQTEVHRGGGGGDFLGFAGTWMFFALPATILLGIIPYSKVVMKAVNHRLNAAGESLEQEEKRGIGLQVVDEQATWRDLELWRKKNCWRAGMAGLAGAIAGVGVTKLGY